MAKTKWETAKLEKCVICGEDTTRPEMHCKRECNVCGVIHLKDYMNSPDEKSIYPIWFCDDCWQGLVVLIARLLISGKYRNIEKCSER